MFVQLPHINDTVIEKIYEFYTCKIINFSINWEFWYKIDVNKNCFITVMQEY